VEAMQWVLLWEHLAQHRQNVPQHHHTSTTFVLTASGISSSSFGRSCKRKSQQRLPVSWCGKICGPTSHQDPCPHINAELLLVSRMNYTMWTLLCPLVLAVNIADAISTELCPISKEHWWNKEMLSTSCIESHGGHFEHLL
jgi:hypothetical protein